VAATIARETHVSDLAAGQESRLQVSFSYSDGFGREIQKKIQAEPGRLDPLDNTSAQLNPRWVGSGWTVFNNKGKPVRQYEPFFSATQGFEFGVIKGVSPVLFYDPAERVIATLHPNHLYEKVLFDPWQQTSYDVNDTCASHNAQTGDPRIDPDIGGHVAGYFKTQPLTWQTWHAERIGGALGPDEQTVAQRAAAHADTPTTAHLDALGRPFLTVARNRVVCAGHALDGTEESFATRVELDIEGNQRAVRDAITHTEALDASGNPVVVDDPLGRIVMRYAYDMLGNRIHQLSMEAGARWMLNDVAGKPIRAWDSRGHNFTTTYDALRRALNQYVRGSSAESDPRTRNPANPRGLLVDKIDYGEALVNAEALNLRSRIYRHSDSAGIATNARLNPVGTPSLAYDFKGNLLCSSRQLISHYKEIPDWGANPQPQLDAETFESSTRYDALNRPIQSVAPHSSLTRPGHPNRINLIQPVFNEANLMERLDVWLEQAAEPTSLLDPAGDVPSPVGVADIDYDAKGQRQRIDYKNGASTVYSYDPLTFRLTQLQTRRRASDFLGDGPQQPDPAWPGRYVQNLHYTYDPAGNITHIQDDAQQIIFFANQRVEPSNDYTYDALYRLIQATGREHLGQNGNQQRHPPTAQDAFNAFHTRIDHPGNGHAMGTYIERYVYDAVGNLLQMQHRGSDPAHQGWTRAYVYLEPSLIEAGTGTAPKTSNRLTRTTLNPAGTTPQPENYGHDVHGNMTRMAHLPLMRWDYRDQLTATARQVVNNGGTPETTYYVYDASGQRIRKVTERQSMAPDSATKKEERIYLDGFEVYREYEANGSTLELERETLHVMDDKQRVALVETRTFPRTPDPGDPLLLIRYQFGNHLGSASLEVDELAQIISYEEYAPYGTSTYQAVRSQTETAKRYRYTGKERDEESGLYYSKRRYLSAWLGRWTAADPMGLIDESNVYRYVRANPVRFVDPNGTFSLPSAAELANSWGDTKLGGLWTPGSLVGFSGEQMTEAADKHMDRVLDRLVDAAGSGSVASALAVGAATLLKTAGTVVVGVASTTLDPGSAVRGIMHLGEGAAAGVENWEAGNKLLGASQIAGDVGTALSIVAGGAKMAKAATKPSTPVPGSLKITEGGPIKKVFKPLNGQQKMIVEVDGKRLGVSAKMELDGNTLTVKDIHVHGPGKGALPGTGTVKLLKSVSTELKRQTGATRVKSSGGPRMEKVGNTLEGSLLEGSKMPNKVRNAPGKSPVVKPEAPSVPIPANTLLPVAAGYQLTQIHRNDNRSH